jgi:hypothetical protein
MAILALGSPGASAVEIQASANKINAVGTLAGVLLVYCVLGLTVGDIEPAQRNHSIWSGVLSFVLTGFLLVTVLYWGSPRFKDGSATRSFADFMVWGRACSLDAWKALKVFSRWAFGFAIVAGLAVTGYRIADSSDRIIHRHNTPVWIQGDWMVGQYRNCDMPVEAVRLFCGNSLGGESGLVAFPEGVSDADSWAAVGAAYNRNNQADWSALEKYFRVLPVRFCGKLQRPEHRRPGKIILWRCQRNTKTVTCNPLD